MPVKEFLDSYIREIAKVYFDVIFTARKNGSVVSGRKVQKKDLDAAIEKGLMRRAVRDGQNIVISTQYGNFCLDEYIAAGGEPKNLI